MRGSRGGDGGEVRGCRGVGEGRGEGKQGRGMEERGGEVREGDGRGEGK